MSFLRSVSMSVLAAVAVASLRGLEKSEQQMLSADSSEVGAIVYADYDAVKYPGIKIRYKDDATDAEGPDFIQVAKDALDLIKQTDTGKMLLKAITDLIASRLDGALARVVIAKQKDDEGSKTVSYADAEVVCVSAEQHKSGKDYKIFNVVKGAGKGSTILWNSVTTVTPDGTRPTYIGLAHELIHAYHNLQADHYASIAATAGGTVSIGTKLDEARTVGFGRFATGAANAEPINENKLREEAGVAARTKYTGKLDLTRKDKWVMSSTVKIPTAGTKIVNK